jgi:tetratricopeptide (TPR) repeat protein
MAVALASGLVALTLGTGALTESAPALTALAEASLRPPVCREQAGGSSSGLWSRTTGASGRSVCDLLARAQGQLEQAPDRAIELAEQARAGLPGQAAPLVVQARALVRKGEWARADQLFSRALTAKDPPFGDAAALRELALTTAIAGRRDEAIALYRKLIPRADSRHDPSFRRLVVLEAASLLGASGPDGAREAAAYLSEARRGERCPGLDDLTSALLSLELERLGDAEQARVVARELPGPWGLERFLSQADQQRLERVVLPGDKAPSVAVAPVFRTRSPLFLDGELHAVLAVAAAERDPGSLRSHLEAYLLGPGAAGPWSSFARGKLAASRGGRR